MIKEHLQAIRQLDENILDLEKTISLLPDDKIRYTLEAELRVMKRVALRYRDDSEELYDDILNFSMKVAVR